MHHVYIDGHGIPVAHLLQEDQQLIVKDIATVTQLDKPWVCRLLKVAMSLAIVSVIAAMVGDASGILWVLAHAKMVGFLARFWSMLAELW